MTEVTYLLEIGGEPASPELLSGIQMLEVEDHADLADMLRLRVSVGVDEGASSWSVLDEDLFTRLQNVRVALKVGTEAAEPLIDAYVVDVRAALSEEPGRSQLEVVAMDGTALLSLEEKVRAWPDQADSAIASAIFSELGFSPVVEDTSEVRSADDTTTLQRGTDIQFLRRLAQRNGYECFVEVGSGGQTEGHFHPPRVEEQPQAILNVNLGSATNVATFTARYDMLGATTAKATGVEVESASDQSADAQAGELKTLGSATTVPSDRPRKVLLADSGLVRSGELETLARSVVDRSSFAVTAEGTVSTAALGKAVRAKRPLLVRGAGRAFSGTYYVERVLHVFSGDGHEQQLRLRRNAAGVAGEDRFEEDRALPPVQAVRI
jgi:phage protein D